MCSKGITRQELCSTPRFTDKTFKIPAVSFMKETLIIWGSNLLESSNPVTLPGYLEDNTLHTGSPRAAEGTPRT